MPEWSEDRWNRLSRYIMKPIAQFLFRNPSREYYSILAGRTVGFKGISLERQKLSLSLRSGLHPFEVHSWIPDPESLEVQHGGSLDSFCPKGPSCVQRECPESPEYTMRSRITIEEIPVEEQAQVPIQAPVPPEEVEPTEAAEEVTPIVTVGA